MQDYNKIMRVAAYCRVSTDKADQVNSLESQKRYFSEYIQRNPMWELINVYADEGVTGTSTKKRHAFNRMIDDATTHRFDVIITKEISRFARNTLDSIFYTRKLKDLGVGVLFMNDNINTMDADAELRLTIMSSIAQEESRKTSDRVKWGQKRRMEQGVVFGRDMLGYDIHDGEIFINEEGAEIVRLIFHKFVREDKGTHVIAREMREAGIKTSTYMTQWSNTVILRVLRNEKYCGDLVQKKTYTPSYLNHEKKYNKGQEEFVVIHDHHEPIISRQMFDQAQQELERRSPSNEQKAKHSNRYCFSGKIKCGLCGCSYVSRTKKRKDGSVYKAWRCFEGAKNGSKRTDSQNNEVGCNNHSVNDEDLKWIMMQVVKNLLVDKESLLKDFTKVIQSAMALNESQSYNFGQIESQIEALRQKKKGLIELYLNKEIDKKDFQDYSVQYEQQITALENDMQTQNRIADAAQNMDDILQDIKKTIHDLICGDEWDDTFYRHILDRIIVYEDNTMDVMLNMLPQSMKYVVCKAFQAKASYNQPENETKNDNRCHFDTSPPISVNKPLSSS